MSFHKRWLNKDNIIRVYEDRGLLGLEKYIGGADALITEDDLSSEIVDVLLSEKLICPPERQSPIVGFGIKVTNISCFFAISLSKIFKNTNLSAICNKSV